MSPAAPLRSGVRLRTNVLCVRLSTNEAEDLAPRPYEALRTNLTYFELAALRDRNPFLFPGYWKEWDQLTPAQLSHRDAFLQDCTEPVWDPGLEGFRPIGLADYVVATEAPPREAPPNAGAGAVIGEQSGSPTASPAATAANVGAFQSDPSAGCQSDVIGAGLGTSMLLLAPPGTGKTHVLIERIAKVLAAGKSADPAHEILVLSFTRATVAEVRRRLAEKVGRESSDDLRYIAVTTFDAFATRVLATCGREHLLEAPAILDGESSFDARIRSLAELLEAVSDTNEVPESIQRLQYLFVDEIQDLVGPRARLVLLLIRNVLRNGGTVLVLGDPAQAIYDYQETPPDSRTFLAELRRLVVGRGRELHLREFFRYTDNRMRALVESLYDAVGVDGSAPDGEMLRSILYGLGAPIGFNEVPAIAALPGGAAVLTRNNAEAHQIAEWLRSNGIDCEHHRGASGSRWPAEIARLLFGWKMEAMSLERLENRMAELQQTVPPEAIETARLALRECGIRRDDSVDVLRVRQIVSTQPAPMLRKRTPDVLVSTIHRSKGLEYERVLLMEPAGDADPEELRVLYVAATRARRELSLLRRDPRIVSRAKRAGKSDYWRVGDSVYLTGARDLDANLLDPTLRRSIPLRELLEHVWNGYAVSAGVSEPLYICIRSEGGREHFTIGLRAGGALQEICRCSGPLSQALWGRRHLMRDLGDGERGWRARVTGLEAIAFPPDSADATEALGQAGMAWLPILESPISTGRDA